jgi:hypothetical protein
MLWHKANRVIYIDFVFPPRHDFPQIWDVVFVDKFRGAAMNSDYVGYEISCKSLFSVIGGTCVAIA